MPKKIKILCVDDNPLVSEAIKIIVNSTPDIEMVGSLHEADALVVEATKHCPDVVLLDIDLPGKSSFDAVEDLSRACPHVRVLMYSWHVRRDLVDLAIERGAWGYVAKTDQLESLLTAIRNVSKGEFSLSPGVKSVYTKS